MKQIIFSLILTAIALAASVSQVSAVEKEAESTGILAQHIVAEDGRADHLEKFLSHYNSPFSSYAHDFVIQADTYNLDWKLVAAISGVESTFGKHIPAGSHNAWGWGIPTGARSGIAFKSWGEGIATVTEGLRTRYFNRGALTIEQVGRIYAASPAWPWKVRFFLTKIQQFRPQDPQQLDILL